MAEGRRKGGRGRGEKGKQKIQSAGDAGVETACSRKERCVDLPQANAQSLKQLTLDGLLNRIRATDETPHILKRNCMHLNGNLSSMLLKIQSTCKKTDDIGPLTARQTLTCLPLPE